jgi:hypothetical protein
LRKEVQRTNRKKTTSERVSHQSSTPLLIIMNKWELRRMKFAYWGGKKNLTHQCERTTQNDPTKNSSPTQ